jgi:uncharacterized RDD family membrane protein YckC
VTTETGVYFRREDYASFWLRVLVDVTDFLVFVALCAVLTIPGMAIAPFNRTTMNLTLLIYVTIAFCYFVVLKRSRFRTLGYRLCRVRIVALNGQPPGHGALILRLMFGALAPLNWLDLIWLSSDIHRQALRDKFANTYVVKANAQAAGQGKVVFQYYFIALYNCLFREVVVDPEPGTGV